MTREEQIDWLCRLRADLNNGVIFTPWNEEFIEALNDVLEQEPTTKNDLTDDCISRKAVLDELGKWDWQELYLPIHFKENIVDVLPSVTPQEPTDKNFTKADIDAIVKAINKGWELRVNEILSKIRAEISTVYESLDGYDPDSLGAFVSKIDEILDKYKAESEADKEQENGTNKQT